MPKHTALSISLCCSLCFLYCFFHSKILMVSGEYFNILFPIAGEQNKVLYDIKQTFPLEHSLIKSIKSRKCCVLITAVFRFPFHEAVNAGSNGSSLISGEITNYADGIVEKHRRNILHIITDLIICILCTNFILRRALQLHKHQWKAVDKQNNIWPSIVPVFQKGELIYNIECIIICPLIVNQSNNRGSLFSLIEVLNSDSILQVVHENHVFLNKTAGIKVLQFGNSFLYGIQSQILVNPNKAVTKYSIKKWTCVVSIHVRSVDMPIAHMLK